MKRILIILMLMMVSKTSALVLPDNIYYIDNGLYAYLNHNENYCLETECTLYIEYQYKELDALDYQSLEKIEVAGDTKTLLLEPGTFAENILIRSRYLTIDSLGNYEYSEWTDDKTISTFDISNLPSPKIKDLNLEGQQLYQIENKLEIDNYVKEYLKYYDEEIIYSLQYRINEEEWFDDKIPSDLNLEDIKIEIRLKYTVGNQESKFSNVLVYEQHPVVEQCLFDTELCCNKVMNISLCLWLLILFIIIVTILIIIENYNRLKKEA